MRRLRRSRRAYDHVSAFEVCRGGFVAQHHRLHIPRSTAATWRSRGPRPVVTLEEFDQDQQQLLDAMHLALHADAKTHARYVMSTKAMRMITSAALPRLPLEARRSPRRA
jgi:hypothetical protein